MMPPLREPDEIDRILFAEMARMRHEHRMKEIREMDIERWAAENADVSLSPFDFSSGERQRPEPRRREWKVPEVDCVRDL